MLWLWTLETMWWLEWISSTNIQGVDAFGFWSTHSSSTLTDLQLRGNNEEMSLSNLLWASELRIFVSGMWTAAAVILIAWNSVFITISEYFCSNMCYFNIAIQYFALIYCLQPQTTTRLLLHEEKKRNLIQYTNTFKWTFQSSSLVVHCINHKRNAQKHPAQHAKYPLPRYIVKTVNMSHDCKYNINIQIIHSLVVRNGP